MLINIETSKRLGIYFFYDSDGIVDDYVLLFLEEYKKCLDKLVIVVNGLLSEDGKTKFKRFSQDIIVKENSGLDVGAYQAAFNMLGWSELETYDEVTIANFTIMGPVYSMVDMYREMSNRDVDFWGITKYFKYNGVDMEGRIPYGYIPEHIQSYFMTFRQSLLSSKEFQDFWDKLPPIKGYQDSVGYFEAVFTKKFEDLGFAWDVYVNTDDLKTLTYYTMLDCPLELVKNRKCPFFKRRSFFEDYDTVHDSTQGQSCSELYNFLHESRLYDTKLIWQNILRTCHQADIAKALHLNYILPIQCQDKQEIQSKISEKKIALFMHLFFVDLLKSSFEYASAMPEMSDIYVTTDTEEKKKIIEEYFSALKCKRLEVKVIENRGRDVSSLLVGMRGIPEKYDYACFFHDKKAGQENPGSIGESFGYKCFENVLHNQDYVYNILGLFEKNPCLGFLTSPEPNHGPYFPTLGNEWHGNFEITKAIAERLELDIPMSEDKEPITSFGSVFWYRPQALGKLQEYPWSYEDFPPEPLDVDHTISHAIERVRGFVVQDAGFYPAFVMTEKYARIEYTNLHEYVRNYNYALMKLNFLSGTQKDVIKRIDNACEGKTLQEEQPIYMQFAQSMEHLLPPQIYEALINTKRKIFGPRDLL